MRVFPVYGSEIISGFGLSERDLLGVGSEARVYGLDPARILKIHVAGTLPGKIKNQKAFYERINQPSASIQFPLILEVHEQAGHFYTIEKRIPGVNMTGVLKDFPADRRKTLLAEYIEAASGLRHLHYDADFYGEILADPPMRADGWPEFLVARIKKTLEKSSVHLAADVPDFARIAEKWYAAVRRSGGIERPGVVHGDFYPDNLMVDPGQGKVTAVIDFSNMALAGDWRLDVVGAEAFLSVTPEEKVFVSALVARNYPEITPEVARLYRTYYAFYFSPAKDESPGFYKWCVASIREFGDT